MRQKLITFNVIELKLEHTSMITCTASTENVIKHDKFNLFYYQKLFTFSSQKRKK